MTDVDELASRHEIWPRVEPKLWLGMGRGLPKGSMDNTFNMCRAPRDSLGGRYTGDTSSCYSNMNSDLGVDTCLVFCCIETW